MRKRNIFWIIWAVLVVMTIGIGIVVFQKIHKNNEYIEQIDLGDKYLQELDYENAELCYREAIKIDGKRVKPYLELSEVYMAQGKYEEAAEILKTAREVVGEAGQAMIQTQLNVVEELKEKAEEPLFIQSNVVQEYQGNTYTTLDSETSDVIVFPYGHFSTLIVYKNYVYVQKCINYEGTSFPDTLLRMNLDGSGQVVLSENLSSHTLFFIYDNVLYFTEHYEGNSNRVSHITKSINLDTLEMEEHGVYTYLFGDEDIRVFKRETDSKICFTKGTMTEMQETVLKYEDAMIGVCGDYIYYSSYYYGAPDRGQIKRYSILDGSEEIIFTDNAAEAVLVNGTLYYLDTVQTLKEVNLRSGEVNHYDISSLEIRTIFEESNFTNYWRGVNNASDTMVYFQRGVQESRYNHEWWSLEKDSGYLERKGVWFQP